MIRWIAVPFAFAMYATISWAQSPLPCPPQTIINDGVCIGEGGKRIECAVQHAQQRVCVQVDPQYTTEAAKANVHGTVRLRATIDINGCAKNIKIAAPLGYGLDQSAVFALERWRFRAPAKPRPVTVEFNFDPKLSAHTGAALPRCEDQVNAAETTGR